MITEKKREKLTTIKGTEMNASIKGSGKGGPIILPANIWGTLGCMITEKKREKITTIKGAEMNEV